MIILEGSKAAFYILRNTFTPMYIRFESGPGQPPEYYPGGAAIELRGNIGNTSIIGNGFHSNNSDNPRLPARWGNTSSRNTKNEHFLFARTQNLRLALS